jgi:hypothetical protein
MPIIYEPRGKAREYSDLAVDLFTGCSHACRYCYCPAVLRKTIDAWALDPQPRKNVLRELERDARRMQGDKREILLSFMSGPYHSDEAIRVVESLRGGVDFWKIGKLNHDRQREAAIDWHHFLMDIEAALDGHRYLIKKGLERFKNAQGDWHGP